MLLTTEIYLQPSIMNVRQGVSLGFADKAKLASQGVLGSCFSITGSSFYHWDYNVQ